MNAQVQVDVQSSDVRISTTCRGGFEIDVLYVCRAVSGLQKKENTESSRIAYLASVFCSVGPLVEAAGPLLTYCY